MSQSVSIPVLVKSDFSFEGVTPLFSSEKKIPGSWQYTIKRYAHDIQNSQDDYGVLTYNYDNQPDRNYLELKFCVSGQTYCRLSDVNCEDCKLNKNALCVEQSGTVDFLHFRFDPVHLTNLITSDPGGETEEILNFRYKHTFSKPIALNGRIRHTLDSILNNRYNDTVENIFINAQTQILLLYTLESVSSIKEDEVPACKFLVHLEDREKIIKAREILLAHIGDPITIKELSRKAAINECYLKKGFKVMFGTTIFDFYQDQRMEHARFLLYEKGFSVSEVSASLGYSSISHFSTAFKKHTGLKPCDLLSPVRHK
jgi:AraC family transcriptional regulator